MAVDADAPSGTPRLGVPHTLFQAIAVQRQVGSYLVTKDGKKFLINSGKPNQATEPLTLMQNWMAELKKGEGRAWESDVVSRLQAFFLI